MAGSKFQVADPTNRDSFVTGQIDKCICTVASILAYPYVGKDSTDNKHYGFLGVELIPDEDTGFDRTTESYFGFYLNKGVPSKDGQTPAGATDEDFEALSRGKGGLFDGDKPTPCIDENRHVIKDHPNVGPYVLGSFIKKGPVEQLYEAFIECDTKGQLQPNGRLDFMVGARFRFDRLPDESPKAKKRDDGSDQLILKPTQLVSLPNEAGAGKSASKSSGKSAAKDSATTSTAASNGGGDLDDQISSEIIAFLAEKGEPVDVATLMAQIPARLKKKAEKQGKTVNRGEIMGWIGDRDKKTEIPVNLVNIDGTEFDPATDSLGLEKD